MRGKTTIHFTAFEANVQLLLKMDMIQGSPEDQVVPGRLVASDQTEQELLMQLPTATRKPLARFRAKI